MSALLLLGCLGSLSLLATLRGIPAFLAYLVMVALLWAFLHRIDKEHQ